MYIVVTNLPTTITKNANILKTYNKYVQNDT